MRVWFVLLFGLVGGVWHCANAQPAGCTFRPPFYRLHFGSGEVRDANASSPVLYRRISSACPPDGFYTYTSFSSDCFNGDWHTLAEDHTPGDAGGNMLLVNSAYDGGEVFSTRVNGFKPATVYRFAVWLMNLCRPTRKCPFPLLPNLLIRLQTTAGKTVAQFSTGELTRVEEPVWAEHRAQFTVPPAETELLLTVINTAPGGCGNDFALDDISFSECVPPTAAPVVIKKSPPATVKKQPPPETQKGNKTAAAPPAPKRRRITTVAQTEKTVAAGKLPFANPKSQAEWPVPEILKTRTTTVVKQIETPPGDIQLDLYDNGEIDGDTVSIYHNNRLVASAKRLSQTPVSLRIQVDKQRPRHELVMVANNLGSIPPNTSLMIVTTAEKRYQVFISSSEQQNATLIITLKE